MLMKSESPANFSLAQARGIVKDLFTPSLAIYWTDFLLSLVAGSIGFVLLRRVFEPWSLGAAVAFVVAGLCYYRAVLFTHELVHLRDERFRTFSIVWNLLVGIPFLMPTFTYYTHVEHHMRKNFGTHDDGEYLPLSTQSPIHILIYMCQPLVFPLIAVLRFLVLTPICWFSPTVRDFVRRRVSSMVMDPSYIRPLPTRQTLRIFRLQETLCFLWCAGVATVIAAGLVPFGFVVTGYFLAVFILTLNNLRTLGAHRYVNADGEMTFLEQLLDSVNYPNRPFLSELTMPVGLRFHALHHLFPSLPYHNLARAHQRLMAELPADSPYRLTNSPSLTAALVQLWQRSVAAGRTAGQRNAPPHTPPKRGGLGQSLSNLTGGRTVNQG
ncbi:MAG: fatty acid desaturase [Pirellulales bacterium]